MPKAPAVKGLNGLVARSEQKSGVRFLFIGLLCPHFRPLYYTQRCNSTDSDDGGSLPFYTFLFYSVNLDEEGWSKAGCAHRDGSYK